MTKTIWLIYLSWMILLIIIMAILTSPIHPVTMVILMLIYNITLCINMELWKSNTIFPIMFFMIMISGLLIIFLYFSSLISNEKSLHLLKNSIKLILLINFFYLLLSNYLFNFFTSSLTFSIQNNPKLMIYTLNPSSPITFIYSSPFSNLTLISMMFLLIALISVIKSSTPKIKSLRKIN